MSYFEQRADKIMQRNRPPVTLNEHERLLVCIDCGTPEIVFEAAEGARTPQEHQWLDPTTFKCWDCLGG